MPTPEAYLLIEPCVLNTEPVKTSDEVLEQDRSNWECAGDWLDNLLAWQQWYAVYQAHLNASNE